MYKTSGSRCRMYTPLKAKAGHTRCGSGMTKCSKFNFSPPLECDDEVDASLMNEDRGAPARTYNTMPKNAYWIADTKETDERKECIAL
jgi:hypothetical protein